MTKSGLLLTFVACSFLVAHAADQKASTNAPPKPAAASQARGMPFYGKLASYDKAAHTITLEGKEKKRIFYLTSSTRVHRDKVPAKPDEMIAGQWIGGFVRPDADGRPTVVTLNLAVTQRNSGFASTNAAGAIPPNGRQ